MLSPEDLLDLATSTASATAIAVVVTSATAETATTAIAATGTTATTIVGLRLCFINNQSATHEFLTIESFDSGVHSFGCFHRDESETSGATGIAIHRHEDFRYFTMGGKQVSQVLFSSIKGQITYVHFCVHILS